MIIILEGNIGAGKSTLLQHIPAMLAGMVGEDLVEVVHEPVEEWCGRQNLLQRYYEDPAEYALQMQITAALNMLDNERFAVELSRQGKYVVMERSMWFSLEVFGRRLIQSTEVSDCDKRIFQMIAGRYRPVIGGHQGYRRYCRLWLQTPVDVCMERIHRRGRPGEESISKDYVFQIANLGDYNLRRDAFEMERSVAVDGTYEPNSPENASVFVTPDFKDADGELAQKIKKGEQICLHAFLSHVVSFDRSSFGDVTPNEVTPK